MSTLKSQFLFLLSSVILLCSINVYAQKHNQYNEKGQRTGVWRKYYGNKRLRYIGQFVNGKEVGTFKYYDILSSKHPTAIKKFYKDSDSASVKFYTTDGVLKGEGKMLGKNRVGKWLYYFPSGKIFSEEFYVEGKLEGKVTTYYKDGGVFEIAHYKNGKKNGKMVRYSDDEVLLEEVIYVDGELNGEGKYYDLKGNLKETGIYKDNKRFGKWEFYIGGKLVDKKTKKEANKFNKSQLKIKDSVRKQNR